MLKRMAPLFLLGIMLLLVGSLAMARMVAARTPAAAQQAQDKPTITLFSTSLKGVDRAALTNRTARIPVSWTTANRPTDANLVFEQVLPDNSVVNVELPRIIPWVNSNGDGVAAPILPPGNVTSIKLRVRLYNLYTQAVYDTKELTLPISNDGSGNSNTGVIPTITAFTTPFVGTVNRNELAAGTARIPVAWTTANRPITANLVFEQVMPDGVQVNVELPRSNPWVNSADKGLVAPKTPTGGTATEVRIRVRLVDLVFKRVYDQRDIVIPIGDVVTGTPSINPFTTTAAGVDVNSLNAGTALVPVTWNVINRPANSNLVFEQVLANGQVRNAELPRNFIIVPSPGQGTVLLISPGGATQVTFRVRLVDLGTGNTLDTKQLTLPITGGSGGNPGGVLSGDACFQNPFPASNGLAANKNARVLRAYNNAPLGINSEPYRSTRPLKLVGEMKTDEVFLVLSGPECLVTDATAGRTVRQWRVKGLAGEGWISDYQGSPVDGIVKLAAGVDVTPPGYVELLTFNVTPGTLNSNGTVTISWELRNASRIILYAGNKTFDQNLALNGTMTLNVKDIMNGNPVRFSLYATDTQSNSVTKDVNVSIDSALAIKTFAVTPTTINATGNITVNWDIGGTFSNGSVLWNVVRSEVARKAADVTTNTGSVTLQVPDSVNGDLTLTLYLTDSNNVVISANVIVKVTCANTTFFVSDPAIQNGRCAGPTSSPQAAYQPFERGFMLWFSPADGVKWILVMYNDGTYQFFGDLWDGKALLPAEAAPIGLISPEHGFGYVWYSNPDVRNKIGWATVAEQGYNATMQSTRAYEKYEALYTYVTLPDGRVVRYASGANSGSAWAFVK